MPKRPPKKPAKRKPAAQKGIQPPKGAAPGWKPPYRPDGGSLLPPIHRRYADFVREYLVDLNATQAAIRAGYSPKSAYSQGQRLLKNVEIKAAVDAGMAKRATKTEITQEKVLKELTVLAHSNVDDYQMNGDGRLVPAEGKSPEVMRAVSSVKYRTRTIGIGDKAQVVSEVEFRLWDKPGTLKLEGRHVGLFPNEVKLTTDEDTLAGLLSAAHDLRAARQ